jgi:GNAT superfamily N-acetyltransferase
LATRKTLKERLPAAPPKAAAAAADASSSKAKKVLAKAVPSAPRVEPDDYYGNAEEEDDEAYYVPAAPKKTALLKKAAPKAAADEEDWDGDVALDAELEALIAADLKANLGDLDGGGDDDSDYDDYELGVEDGDLVGLISDDDDGNTAGNNLEASAEPVPVVAAVRLAALEGRWRSLYTDQTSGVVSETVWQIAASGVAVYRAVAPGSQAAAVKNDNTGWSAPAPETNLHENAEQEVQRGDGWALGAASNADRLVWRLPGDAHDGLVWTRVGVAPPAALAASAAALAAAAAASNHPTSGSPAAKTRAAPGVVAQGETKGGLSLTLRRAKPSDLKKIGAMAWAPVAELPSGARNTPAEAAQWVVAELARGFGGVVAVARAGPPAGAAASANQGAELTSLVVAPSARQRGVAGAVVDYVVATSSAAAAAELVARLPGYKNKAAKKAVQRMFEARGVRVLENF